MTLNALSTRKRRWLWVLLFVSSALLVGTLATGWNLVLVRHYQKMVELARNLSLPSDTHELWLSIVLGTLGFAATLAIIILIFFRLLQEMRLNQLQSEFLAAVSHELKTPIAALDLSSSLIRSGLKQGDLSQEEQNHLWETHATELKRLRDEVETLLETARWQAGPVSLSPSRIHLETWLDEFLARWKILLGPSAVIRREGQPLDLSPWIDLKTLNLIADNILDNARKFSRGTPQITVRTERTGQAWKIDFIDEGWGFDPKDSKKIFHRFVRTRSGAPHTVPGTGLGLHLAESACRALGISIRGKSDGIGRGGLLYPDRGGSPRMSETHPLFETAVLVEDESSLVTALKIALRKLQISTHHAGTLQGARELIFRVQPELVLLDRNLPDGDGIDLCRSLREAGFSGTILMLTASGQTHDRVSGLNSGADDYLAKPFSWEELDARIRALARRKPPSSPLTAIWQLDEDRLRILGPRGWTTLTPLEFKLAQRLIQAHGAIVSREDLLKNVWGFTLLPKTRTVDHFLGRLRKHFEENPEEPQHFLTVRGAGYRFELS